MSRAYAASTALSQFRALISSVGDDQREWPTPCEDWNVTQLIDHVVHTTGLFVQLGRGHEVDWTQPAPHHDEPIETFMESGFDIVALVTEVDCILPRGMVAAELAVHTWDLSTALGRTTSQLDPMVAEMGMEYLVHALTDDHRGGAFGPEQPVPEGADAYQRIAAFAGRRV